MIGQLHLTLGLTVVVLNLLAGLWGLGCWYRRCASRLFWRLARAGQAALTVQVALGGALLLSGHRPQSELHVLYGLLAVGAVLVAEQLRVNAAPTVVEAAGYESAQALRGLGEERQQAVALAIVRREIVVVALAALMTVALAWRAAATAGAIG